MRAELPVGAFIAAFIVLVPLPWHWRARNVPTLSIIAWLFISNTIYGVNAVIWANNVDNFIPVWCDVATKVQIGATMALPACCLCLCIHLERISSVRQISMAFSERRRRMIFDGLMCWGVPLVYMALHFVVQGHRYDIIENLGCRPAIFNSIASILIVWLPPLLIVFLVLVYAGLSIHHFLQRRLTFARHLQSSNSALTTSTYLRLMAMAIVQMFWVVLLIAFNMWFTCRNGLRPWINWQNVHFNFSRVGIFPELIIPQFVLQWAYFSWWSLPASSFLFFVFFAFGQDALKEYAACFHWIQRVIFRRDSSGSKASLPNSPNVRIDLSKKVSNASSFATKVEHDIKPSSGYELSSQSKLIIDSSSSIYSSAPYTPSTSWSESFMLPPVEHAESLPTHHLPRDNNV